MRKVVIVSAVRTPIGKFGGCFRPVGAIDLLIHVMRAAVDRANINTAELDQIIMGNNFAHLDLNVSRLGSLTWGLPDFKDPYYDIPGYTINCTCISASQAIILGTNAIKLGQADAVIAGGVESMSTAPYLLENCRWGQRLRHEVAIDVIWRGMQEFPIGGGMGLAAERLAKMYKISREELDELGLNREITTVSGSGISIGHPVGATGSRMVVTMIHEMERRGLNLGISALCGGGGLGTAILIER